MRSDQRLSPRRNVTIEAALAFDAGRKRVDCIIRNISEGGAKIEVARVSILPSTFDLLLPGHAPQPCRVVWRALREVGVEFL
jgi:hypothetical protein